MNPTTYNSAQQMFPSPRRPASRAVGVTGADAQAVLLTLTNLSVQAENVRFGLSSGKTLDRVAVVGRRLARTGLTTWSLGPARPARPASVRLARPQLEPWFRRSRHAELLVRPEPPRARRR